MRFNNYIDHTNLGIKAKEVDIVQLCTEAKQFGFAAVCVSPNHVPIVARELKGTQIGVCTVIGFPNGYVDLETKKAEMKDLIRKGANELDVVLNLQDVADKKWGKIKTELCELRSIAETKIVKLIIESSLLTDEEIRKVSELACEEKINYVKTSTGFNGKATLHAVKIIKSTVGERALIKASGGIKTKTDAKMYIDAGATRLGTSSGIFLVS